MKGFFTRIWAGIVGGLAGACVGFVVSLLLTMAKFPLETALWAVAVLGGLGVVFGLVFGKTKIGGK